MNYAKPRYDYIVMLVMMFVPLIMVLSQAGLLIGIDAKLLVAMLGIIVFGAQILFHGYILPTQIFFLGLTIIFPIINFQTELISLAVLVFFMYVVDFSGMDSRLYSRFYAIPFAIAFGMVVIANITTGFNTHDVVVWQGGVNTFRRTFGFYYANQASMLLCGLVFGLVLLAGQRFVRMKLMLISLAAWYVLDGTNSRTSMYILAVSMGLFFVLGKHSNGIMPKFVSYIVSMAPWLFMGISMYLLLTPYSDELNSLATGRLALYQAYFKQSGYHFLADARFESAMLDNSYLQELMTKGILFVICHLVLLSLMVIGRRISIRTAIFYISFLCISLPETALQHFELLIPIVISMIDDKRRFEGNEYL